MQVIRKVCNDNKLELEDMHDFLISLSKFLKKFDTALNMTELKIHLQIAKKAAGLFGRAQREYLDSVIDFTECFDQSLTIEQLQVHLKSALDYLTKDVNCTA